MQKRMETATRRGMFGLVLSIILLASATALAARLGERDKAAYVTLAEHIPADAAFTAMATNINDTARNLEAALKRYQKADRSFQYETLELALKGGLGFNPLSNTELAATGLDPVYGLAAFSMTQDGAPLIHMRLSNPAMGVQTLADILTKLTGAKPAPEEAYRDFRVRAFTKDGTAAGKFVAGIATRGDTLYFMAEAGDRAWFTKHIDAVSTLVPGHRLSDDKAFKGLLGRLDAGTSFISYSNYSVYYRELKRGKDRLKNDFFKPKGLANLPALDLLDDATALAEGFTAQIFAVSIKATGLSFVHQLTGPGKKVRELQALLKPSAAGATGGLGLSGDYVGRFQAALDPARLRAFLSQRSDAFKREYGAWNQLVEQKSKLDFDKDFVDNFNGDFSLYFYGMGSLPESLIRAKTVNSREMLGLARLVAVASLKNPDAARALLVRAEAAIKGEGHDVKVFTIPGAGDFLSFFVDGVPLSLGIFEKWLVLGVGTGAVEAALANRAPAPRLESNVISSLSFRFKPFARSMDGLRPPKTSANTQLFQQYQVWEQQIAAKIRFLDQLDIKTTMLPDGFLTRGEVRF